MEVCKTFPRIGVIDSGVGGLTVLVRLIEAMPRQPFFYLADHAWCPYGSRPVAELQGRLTDLVAKMIARGCGLVVVACNTATAAAIDLLRATFPIPFVGMEPAVKPAALHSKTHHIGVLATEGTLHGSLFQKTTAACAKYANVHIAVGTGLVELVESGRADSPEARERLQELLAPLLALQIDQLVLGCTHYPLLMPALVDVLPEGVTILDPAPAVARHTCRLMEEISRQHASDSVIKNEPRGEQLYPRLEFFSTTSTPALEDFARRVFAFYGLGE